MFLGQSIKKAAPSTHLGFQDPSPPLTYGPLSQSLPRLGGKCWCGGSGRKKLNSVRKSWVKLPSNIFCLPSWILSWTPSLVSIHFHSLLLWLHFISASFLLFTIIHLGICFSVLPLISTCSLSNLTLESGLKFKVSIVILLGLFRFSLFWDTVYLVIWMWCFIWQGEWMLEGEAI